MRLALAEGVFQAVGLATQHGLLVRGDGSETHHLINIAPADPGERLGHLISAESDAGSRLASVRGP